MHQECFPRSLRMAMALTHEVPELSSGVFWLNIPPPPIITFQRESSGLFHAPRHLNNSFLGGGIYYEHANLLKYIFIFMFCVKLAQNLLINPKAIYWRADGDIFRQFP